MKRKTILLIALFVMFSFSMTFAQLDELKKALGSIPGMNKSDSKTSESINWKPLSKLLPETIDGYESSKLDGGTFKTADPSNPTGQYSYSSVSKTFTSDKKRFKVTILDSGYNQLLMAPFIMSYEYDGPEGYMKSIKVGDHNAKEMVELDGDFEKSAKLMVAVKDRVLVMFEGFNGFTIDDVKKQSNKMDYAKIASLIGDTESTTEEAKK